MQRLPPVDWCPYCGRELYGGEEAWRLGGRWVHGDCLGDYAKEVCPRATMGRSETEKGTWI